jgi:F-type H+-transporting ATPase subunit b
LKRLSTCLRAALLAAAFSIAVPGQQPPDAPSHEPGQEVQEEHHGEDHVTLWKTANFLLFAGALGYFLYKHGGPFFRTRTEQIRRGITEASKLREEAEARYALMERRLANLGDEIENLRRTAREESAAEGERIRQETRKDLQKIHAQAELEIAAAGKAARQELRAYAAELAVSVAKQRIRERITPELDDRLVQATVGQLARSAEPRVEAR